jgi:hypothetical protein
MMSSYALNTKSFSKLPSEGFFFKAAGGHLSFSKEFDENLGSMLTNRKRGIKYSIVISEYTPTFGKLLANSKAFGVKRPRFF